MGYGLVREIASNRPPSPGPEWWLLLDLADDADDVTRQTACGYEYMAERTQASRPTIYRWLQRLTDAGLITVAQRSKSAGRNGGKGVRAVYEIQVPPRVAARVEAALNRVSSCVRLDSEMGSHKKRPDSAENGVSPRVRPDYPAEPDNSPNGVSRNMRPPLQDPIGRTPVEGADLRADQNRGDEEERKIKNTHPEREARRAPAA